MKRDWINDPQRVWTYQTRIVQRLGNAAIREELADEHGSRWYRDGFDLMAELRTNWYEYLQEPDCHPVIEALNYDLSTAP